jgi:hypothetical protein
MKIAFLLSIGLSIIENVITFLFIIEIFSLFCILAENYFIPNLFFGGLFFVEQLVILFPTILIVVCYVS